MKYEFRIFKKGITTAGKVTIFSKPGEPFDKKEKQQLIDAVNSHDKDCINTANNVVQLIKPSAPKEFFTYDGKAGTEYYNKTFTKQ